MLFSFHGSLLLEAAFIYYHKKIILSTTIFIFFKIFFKSTFWIAADNFNSISLSFYIVKSYF